MVADKRPTEATPKPKKRTNGDGSVYYRASDKRWCASLSLPSADGSPRRVTRTATTKKLAEVELTKLRREKDLKGDIQTTTLSVATWCRAWLEQTVAGDLRPKTVASYRTTVEQYIIPAIGTKQLKKLTADHVRDVTKYIEGKGLSSRTSALAYQVLSLALDQAFREKKVQENVAKRIKRPRTKKPTLSVLSGDDAFTIIEAVKDDRLGSRIAAAFYTGARQGELIGLEWSRVNFLTNKLDLSWQMQRVTWEHGCGASTSTEIVKGKGDKPDRERRIYPCSRVRGTDCPKRHILAPADWEHRHITGGLYWSRPKSEAGKRPLHMVKPLRDKLEERLRASVLENNPHGLVWTTPSGAPLDPSIDNQMWHDALKLAEVPDARLHDARHATASALRKAGVNIGTITRIMGHSSQAMSEEYIDYDDPQLAEAMEAMSALMIEKA